MKRVAIAFWLLLLLPSIAHAQLAAALLPVARSVRLGQTASAFATIINTSATATAHSCGIAPATSVPGPFIYQTTDPHTNQAVGTPNTPVNIPPGASQTYVVAFTPTAEFTGTVLFLFDCADTAPAQSITDVNTLELTVVNRPVDDVIPIAVTLTGNGIADIPGLGGTGVFAVAAVNIGDGAVCCLVHADTAAPNVVLSLCRTDSGGHCLSPPVQGFLRWDSTGSPATFTVFAKGSGNVPFDPAMNRIFVSFKDFALFFPAIGLTSVAVRTVP